MQPSPPYATHSHREMTPEQVQYAIEVITEWVGKPPAISQSGKWIDWVRGREHRAIALIDLQHPGNHQVGLWAWDCYPLEEQKLAYQLARKLRERGIPVIIYRGLPSPIVKLED